MLARAAVNTKQTQKTLPPWLQVAAVSSCHGHTAQAVYHTCGRVCVYLSVRAVMTKRPFRPMNSKPYRNRPARHMCHLKSVLSRLPLWSDSLRLEASGAICCCHYRASHAKLQHGLVCIRPIIRNIALVPTSTFSYTRGEWFHVLWYCTGAV